MGELLEQIRQIWDKMDKKKRLLLIGGTLLFLLGFFFFLHQVSKTEYELLYGNLSQIEQDEIIGALKEMNVPYRKERNAIYVPNASEVRAELMKTGIPKGGIVGWEIFDQTSLGATHFTNLINYQRALQNEIRRTLREIEGIVDAHVILDLPDQQPVFRDERKEPSAAITLILERPDVLSQRQVAAITNLVAGTVVGMSVDNITIIDNFANDLTAPLRKNEISGLSLFEDQFAIRRAFEQDLERSLERLLGRAFGLERVSARVSVEMNFDRQEVRKEIYGTRGVPRSEQEITETYHGEGHPLPYGIPGTDSNIVEYRFLDEGGESSYDREERIVNYEIDRIEEYLIRAPGRVERVNVALLIGEELTPAQQARIEELVGAAVGYNMERGDTISVVSMPFTVEEPLVPLPEPFAWGPVINWAGLLLMLVLGLLFVWRMIAATRPKPAAVDVVVGDEEPEETAAAVEEGELTEEEKRRRQRQEFLQNMAREKPYDVAALLKTWLLED